jgi:hypothetical protein
MVMLTNWTCSRIVVVSALALVGCTSTDDAANPGTQDAGAASGLEQVVPRPGSAPGPWTLEFEREAVLIAHKITIEGPSDLLEHIVVRQEPGVVDMVQETTTAGLVQTLRRKPEAGVGEIRAWLDQWSIVALRELVILQRPGEVPVRVIAEGDAAWIPTAGGDELRRGRLEFTGQRGR